MFTRQVDDELELELMHDRLARELFLVVDENRVYLRRWLSWVDETRQILDSREFLRLSMAGWAEGRMLRCAIRWRGRLCGSVSLEGVSGMSESAEVGYWLAEDCQGHGVMTRSVAAITSLGLVDLGLHRLVLRAAAGNTRSWAVPERLGWTFEGVARDEINLYGEWLDVRQYSMLAPDWASRS